jgi:hypothetical protein
MIVLTESETLALAIPVLPGEETYAAVLGIWDGATATLATFVDGAWRTVQDGTFTADFEVVRVNGAGSQLRLTISDVGDTTNLSVNLVSLP